MGSGGRSWADSKVSRLYTRQISRVDLIRGTLAEESRVEKFQRLALRNPARRDGDRRWSGRWFRMYSRVTECRISEREERDHLYNEKRPPDRRRRRHDARPSADEEIFRSQPPLSRGGTARRIDRSRTRVRSLRKKTHSMYRYREREGEGVETECINDELPHIAVNALRSEGATKNRRRDESSRSGRNCETVKMIMSL